MANNQNQVIESVAIKENICLIFVAKIEQNSTLSQCYFKLRIRAYVAS